MPRSSIDATLRRSEHADSIDYALLDTPLGVTGPGHVWALPDDLDGAFHAELSLFAAVLGAQDAGEDVYAGRLVDQLLLDAAR